MNNSRQNIYNECLSQQEIFDYIKGNLSENKLNRVQTHLLNCNLCSDAADGLKLLSFEKNPAAELKKLRKTAGYKKEKTSSGMRHYISAAAVLLVIFSSLFLLMRKSHSEIVFDEYYKPYPNIVPMVRGEGREFDLRAAMILYNSGRYEEAVNEFNKILVFEPGNENAIFYKGVAQISLDKPEEALKQFRMIIRNRDSQLYDQSAWYSGLAFLKMGEIKNAESVFQQIADDQNYYSERAAEILSKIKDE